MKKEQKIEEWFIYTFSRFDIILECWINVGRLIFSIASGGTREITKADEIDEGPLPAASESGSEEGEEREEI